MEWWRWHNAQNWQNTGKRPFLTPFRLINGKPRDDFTAAATGCPVTYLAVRQRWVKIGHSRSLPRRMQALRWSAADCSTPSGMQLTVPMVLAALAATLPGLDWEAVLHQRFATHHAAGEWFAAAPVLEGLAALIRTGVQVTWWP